MNNLSTHYLNAKKTNPWERSITVAQNKRVSKKKTVNEIFKACSEKDTSKYWKAIFDNAAVGKFHAGYSFKNNILMCKNGNQVKELSLPDDIDSTIQACKEFFNHNSGLISPTEKEEERKNEKCHKGKNREVNELQWENINKKHKQSAHIRKYVQRISLEKQFTEKESVDFLNFINFHLLLKNLNSSHFEFKNGEIKSIKNIIYDSKTRLWEIEKVSKVKSTTSSSNKKKTDYWHNKPIPADFDTKFSKEIEAIYKPKLSDHKFIPQSLSDSPA